MPTPTYSSYLERAIAALLEMILWASAVAGVVFVACGVAIVGLRYVTRRWQPEVRGVHGFVAALVSGDFEGADIAAGRLLCANDSVGNKRLLGDVPARFRRLGARRARARRPLEFFDAQTVLHCEIDELTRVIDGPANLAAWFGVVRDPEEASVVVQTRNRVLRLQGVVERWQPEVWTLLAEARTADGSPVRSHVTLRQAMVAGVGPMRQGVQVWVHVELPANHRGRRALTCLRPAIEDGLRRLEAEFDAG